MADSSIKALKFQTARLVILEGIEILIRATIFKRYLWIKRVMKEQPYGDVSISIAFNKDERHLIHEARGLLQSQTTDTVTIIDTIIIAIYAVDDTK